MAEIKYRVVNKCKYDIGVTLANGQHIAIRAGSFQLMSADDITFTESICVENKFFAKRMLVAYDSTGKEVPLQEMGMYIDADDNPHLDDEEIKNMLKLTPKKIEAWLENVTDPAELHGIFAVAKELDLPASKLKLISAKLPEKNIFE